jgi:hypothetical protein
MVQRIIVLKNKFIDLINRVSNGKKGLGFTRTFFKTELS